MPLKPRTAKQEADSILEKFEAMHRAKEDAEGARAYRRG